MAIVFDTEKTVGNGTSTNPSVSYTTGSGTSSIGIVWFANMLVSSTISSITWGGVAMTKVVFQYEGSGGNPDGQGFYYILAPSGTQTISISASSNVTAIAATFFGVNQFTPVETNLDGSSHSFVQVGVSGVTNGSPINIAGTANTAGEYFLSIVNPTNTVGVAGSTVSVSTLEGVGWGYTPISSTGSNNATWTNNSGTTESYTATMIGLIPVITPSPLVSDSTAITDVPTIAFPRQIAIFENVNPAFPFSVKDSVSVAVSSLPVFTDQICSLTASFYKWMTSTLYSAVQSFLLRPYFEVKILDDRLVYNQTITMVDGPAYGKCTTSPDGYILAAGFSGTDTISFWKVPPNFGGSWTSYQTSLVSNVNIAPFIGFCGIACSNWINGSYQIDIYYTSNNSGSVQLNWIYSTNGGSSWSSAVTLNAPTGGINYTNVQDGTWNYCLQAAQPTLLSNGTVQSACFYIQQNANTFDNGASYPGYDIWYQVNPGTGTFSSPQIWSQKNVNSQDWTIHSFDVYYLNGNYVILMAALHNIYETINTNLTATNTLNYSIYQTSISVLTGVSNNDLWTYPVDVLPTISGSAINIDSYILPTLSFDGTYLNLLFRATVLLSATATSTGGTANISTGQTYYYLMRSQDGMRFSYPTAISDSNGNPFADTVEMGAYGFIYQAGYYYTLGSQNAGEPTMNMFQYVKNNNLLDVTDWVIGFSITQNVGGPSSISLVIGNMNNQYYGGTNLLPNANAIQKNAKICVFEGYYNANGVPEVIPSDVFYIDDITQNVTATLNDLVIAGRNVYKPTTVTTTRFAYTLNGPTFYSDVFDGSTLASWNQVGGTWVETGNTMTGYTNSGDAVLSLSGVVQNTPSSEVIVTFNFPTLATEIVYIYAVYQDSTHWIRLALGNSDGGPNNYMTWAIQYQNSGGAYATEDSGVFDDNDYSSTYPNYTVMIRRYDWYKMSFFIGANATTTTFSPVDPSGQTLFQWSKSNTPGSEATMLNSEWGGTGTGEYDFTSIFADEAAGFNTLNTVALGLNGYLGTAAGGNNATFSFFKFSQFANAQSIEDLYKWMGTLSSVYSYKNQNNFEDWMFAPSNYTGTFTNPNRTLLVGAGNFAINNISANQIGNGSIEFDAILTPTNPTNDSGFSLIFRSEASGNTNNCYLWNNGFRDEGAMSYSRFLSNASNTSPSYSGTYLLNSSSMQYELFTAGVNRFLGSINVNFAVSNHFKIVMVDGWFYGFINNIMVVAWQDNNTTQGYYTNGYWGFEADANSTVQITNVKSSSFYNPIASFSLNPGDEVETAMETLEQTVGGWHFSDLLGRFKTRIVSNTDPSTYTYNSIIIQQGTDLSDKEYVNQVTVYGANGIVATASDQVSISSTGHTREMVVVNYQVTSLSAAQTLANQTLIQAEQYLYQYSPTVPLNPGSELFDVITVINTGNNTSGVNSPTRVYGQTVTAGGSNQATYSTALETGQE